MKTIKKLLVLTFIVVMVMVLAIGCGEQQEGKDKDAFPNKTITIICNYGAGGGTDLECRALANVLEGIVGVPVQVVDKEGGSGTVGITELKNSKPDGYTIGIVSYSPMAIVPNTIDVSYTADDFRYLGNLTSSEYALFAKADAPYDTFEEYIEYSIKNGGTTSFGAGYPHPLFSVNANKEFPEAKIQFVNQGSSAEVVTALIGGHTDVATCVAGDALNYVKSGEIKCLATLGATQSTTYPDKPCLYLEGHTGINLYTYMAIGCPAGVDDETYNYLCDAIKQACNTEDFKTQIKNLNLIWDYFEGEKYGEILKQDIPVWQEYFASQK